MREAPPDKLNRMPFVSLSFTRTYPPIAGKGDFGNEKLEIENCADRRSSYNSEGRRSTEADFEEDVTGQDYCDDASLPPMQPSSPTPDRARIAVMTDWDLHVLYDEAYRTPTLWLRVTRADGAPFIRDELARFCGIATEDTDQENGVGRWTILSQDEHPLLGLPYFFLHPCGTPARMSRLICSCQNEKEFRTGRDVEGVDACQRGLDYLIQWFSLVAPVLGLKIPPQFVQAILFSFP